MECWSHQKHTKHAPHCLWHFRSLLEEVFDSVPGGEVWKGRGWTQTAVTMCAPGTSDSLSLPEMFSFTAGTERCLTTMMIIKSHAPGLCPAGMRQAGVLGSCSLHN